MENVVSFSLNIIFNSSQKDLFYLYYSRVQWIDFCTPWINCDRLEFRWCCKFILGNLLPILEEKEYALLDLKEDEVSIFISGLIAACSSSVMKVQIKGTVFSALELLNILTSLLCGPQNRIHIATPAIIEPLSKLIACDKVPEQIAACKLVWSILDQGLLSENLRIFQDSLKSLEFSENAQLQTISNCVLLSLEGNKLDTGLYLIARWIQEVEREEVTKCYAGQYMVPKMLMPNVNCLLWWRLCSIFILDLYNTMSISRICSYV